MQTDTTARVTLLCRKGSYLPVQYIHDAYHDFLYPVMHLKPLSALRNGTVALHSASFDSPWVTGVYDDDHRDDGQLAETRAQGSSPEEIHQFWHL